MLASTPADGAQLCKGSETDCRQKPLTWDPKVRRGGGNGSKKKEKERKHSESLTQKIHLS